MLRSYYGYIEHSDPLAHAGNKIAMFILSNQPFYPLYIYLHLGGRFWPSLLTLFSSPFYAAVPWLMRRNMLSGKWLLFCASVGNTLISIKALGSESGLELFLFPCAVLGALVFSEQERWSRWIAAIAPIAIYLVMRGRYGTPLEVFSAAEYATLLTLHAVSAGAICVVICFMMSSAWRARSSLK